MPRHASHDDAIHIHAKLATVVRKTGNDTCEYVDKAISDDTVAAQFGVSKSAVAGIRRRNFGALPAPTGGNGVAPIRNRELSEKFEEIERRLKASEQHGETLLAMLTDAARQLHAVQDAFGKLCMGLSVKHVLDARDLAAGLNGALKGSTSHLPPITRR